MPVGGRLPVTGRVVGFGIAVVIVGIATLSWFAGPLENNALVVSLFGPPRPQLEEKYATEGRDDVDHSAFTALLERHVRGERVDYTGLAAQSDALEQYIAMLERADFDAQSRDAKLALLINAYNAFTLRLILDHGGSELTSIKDIPSDARWDAVRWTLAGETLSLSALEHEWLRARFVEPRIHFAINCASVGCPPLRNEAYTAGQLERQLEEQAATMHQSPTWLEVRDGTVHLTPLYLWYASDFEAVEGSVLAYASQWADVSEGQPVAYLPYDWSLNDAL